MISDFWGRLIARHKHSQEIRSYVEHSESLIEKHHGGQDW